MDEKTIRNDLKDIRYYYANQKDFDIAFKSVNSMLVEKVERYKEMMSDAPLPIYLCFFNLYVNGWTQQELAEEMGVSRTVIARMHKKMVEFVVSKSLH